MFIRRKTVRGTVFYQVVESRRVEGKPRQVIVRSLAQYPTVRALIGDRNIELRRLWRELLFCPSHEAPCAAHPGRLPERIRRLQAEVKELAELSAKLGDPISLHPRVNRDPMGKPTDCEATDAAGYKWIVAADARPEKMDVGEISVALGWTRHKVRMARYVAAYGRRTTAEGEDWLDHSGEVLKDRMTVDDAFGRVAHYRSEVTPRPRERYPDVHGAPAFALRREWKDVPRLEQLQRLREFVRN